MAVLTYNIHFQTLGKYWLWARAFTTTSEDNGMHFGIDWHWPTSAARWQTTARDRWHWASKQRTKEVRVGVPGILTLDAATAGVYRLHISVREDGIALDPILLVNCSDDTPQGIGPATKLHFGRIAGR